MKLEVTRNFKPLSIITFSVTVIHFMIILPVQVTALKGSDQLCYQLDPDEIFFPDDMKAPPRNDFCIIHAYANDSYVNMGDVMNITITSEKLHKFTGIILQGRYCYPSEIMIVGKFVEQENTTLYDCGDEDEHEENTLVYKGSENLTSYTVQWVAPTHLIGDVSFFVTIVRDNNTYWQFRKTDYVTVVSEWYPKQAFLLKKGPFKLQASSSKSSSSSSSEVQKSGEAGAKKKKRRKKKKKKKFLSKKRRLRLQKKLDKEEEDL
ncbi:uncharacterized protein LOC142320598 [Lycorma delicatula]|uniref:uncharacterized protein LOC142320598 n=1 Tax=Lycorma delicatula TaxID=130591 RepID=UPI003F519D63